MPHQDQEEVKSPDLKELLNIAEDINDLREIKDIRDELNIMSSVFHTQDEVMKTMDHILREQNDRRNDMTGWPRRTRSNFSHMTASSDDNAKYSSEDINDQRLYHSPMLTVVDRNIREVERLDRFAERAARAVKYHHLPFVSLDPVDVPDYLGAVGILTKVILD
jgi:hypothetical protein